MLELLQERVTLFSDLAEVTGGQEVTLPPNSRNLFRADTPQAPRGEKLLMDAVAEGALVGGEEKGRKRSIRERSRLLVLCYR